MHFECALVGTPDWSIPKLRDSPGVHARSSAAEFERRHSYDYTREVFNAGDVVVESTDLVALEPWLSAHPGWVPDLIKIDTDGADLGVIRSLGDRLGDALAIQVEVNFDGDAGPEANTFGTVFNTLVSAGYRLFSLTTTRYSRAAMPRPFAWDIPAQTVGGQINQGDALFCKDLAVEGAGTPVRLLKLACLFDLFGLQDCAAELIEVHSDAIEGVSPLAIGDVLEVLAQRSELGIVPRAARQLLEERPETLFPSTGDASWITRATEPPMHAWPAAPPGDGTSRPLDPRPVGIAPGTVIHFAEGMDGARALSNGWWPPERTGVWTAQGAASIVVESPREIPAGTRIIANCWRLPIVNGTPRLAIVLNGCVLIPEPMPERANIHCFRLADDVPAGPGMLTVHAWPLCEAPEQEDERLLGLHLHSLEIVDGVSV